MAKEHTIPVGWPVYVNVFLFVPGKKYTVKGHITLRTGGMGDLLYYDIDCDGAVLPVSVSQVTPAVPLPQPNANPSVSTLHWKIGDQFVFDLPLFAHASAMVLPSGARVTRGATYTVCALLASGAPVFMDDLGNMNVLINEPVVKVVNYATQALASVEPTSAPADLTPKCECGADACGSSAHSTWCPMAGKFLTT